jgi:hypothetical protein
MKIKKTVKKLSKPKSRFPAGWDQKRVQAVIDHYQKQTEDDAVAEDEAAYKDSQITMMAVPAALVPAVRKLIAKRAG